MLTMPVTCLYLWDPICISPAQFWVQLALTHCFHFHNVPYSVLSIFFWFRVHTGAVKLSGSVLLSLIWFWSELIFLLRASFSVWNFILFVGEIFHPGWYRVLFCNNHFPLVFHRVSSVTCSVRKSFIFAPQSPNLSWPTALRKFSLYFRWLTLNLRPNQLWYVFEILLLELNFKLRCPCHLFQNHVRQILSSHRFQSTQQSYFP